MSIIWVTTVLVNLWFSGNAFTKLLRCVHVTLPDQKELAQMLQLKMKNLSHSILKCEFDHLSKFLMGFSPDDIDRIVFKALDDKYELLDEAKSFKKVRLQDGSMEYCICNADDPDKVNVTSDEVLLTGFATPKVSAKELLEIIKRSRPLYSSVGREEYDLFEKNLGSRQRYWK